MANDERKALVSRVSGGLRGASATSEKLANTPLAVLLPQLGELSNVLANSSFFSNRLAELQNQSSLASDADADPEQRRLRAMEESMLNQVIQWLSIQSSRD